MQSCEGYFENGRFVPIGNPINIPDRRRVVLTVLDEPAQADDTHAEAWRVCLEAIQRIDDEPIPEFERIRFKEADI